MRTKNQNVKYRKTDANEEFVQRFSFFFRAGQNASDDKIKRHLRQGKQPQFFFCSTNMNVYKLLNIGGQLYRHLVMVFCFKKRRKNNFVRNGNGITTSIINDHAKILRREKKNSNKK